MQTGERTLRYLAILAVLAVIGTAVYLMAQPGTQRGTIGEDVGDAIHMRQYDSALYGIAFTYPDTYVLTERDIGNSAERTHHSITLVDKQAAATVPQNGEGPTAITIDLYGNGIDKLTAETWIRNTSASNFKLSPDQKLATTTVAGTAAYVYTWDGLYRGDSVVFEHGSDVAMFTVTYMTATDTIRSDFQNLLSSLILK